MFAVFAYYFRGFLTFITSLTSFRGNSFERFAKVIAELGEDLNIDLLEEASRVVPQPPENLISYGGLLHVVCYLPGRVHKDGQEVRMSGGVWSGPGPAQH